MLQKNKFYFPTDVHKWARAGGNVVGEKYFKSENKVDIARVINLAATNSFSLFPFPAQRLWIYILTILCYERDIRLVFLHH